MPGGRPSDYTPAIADEICTRLANGESLRAICASDRDDFIPHIGTVLRWVGQHEDFREQYARAREIQAETMADEIIGIADDADIDAGAGVAKARLQVDARKWVASKLLPKKYGDKLQQEVSGPDGQPIRQAHSLDTENLTDDQLRVLASIKV
jgi:hypothetical protein